MKYPDKLHLEIPIKKNEAFPLADSLCAMQDKVVTLSRDPNHPRAGVDYKVTNLIAYDTQMEIVLERI